jgi:hypothetical protein
MKLKKWVRLLMIKKNGLIGPFISNNGRVIYENNKN